MPATIDLGNISGLKIQGSGGVGQQGGKLPSQFTSHATYLRSTGTIFKLGGTGCVFEGLNFWGGGIVNYASKGLGSGKHTFRDCSFVNCDFGVQFGTDIEDDNCDLFNFDNVHFINCKVGIVAMNNQCVGGIGRGLRFLNCINCFDFQRGGSAYFDGVRVANCATILNLGVQGVNNKDFGITGLIVDNTMPLGWALARYVTNQTISFSGRIGNQQRNHLRMVASGNLENIDISSLKGTWK